MFKKMFGKLFSPKENANETTKETIRKKRRKPNKYKKVEVEFPEFFSGTTPDLSRGEEIGKLKEELLQIKNECDMKSQDSTKTKTRINFLEGKLILIEEGMKRLARKVEIMENASNLKEKTYKVRIDNDFMKE